jgi:hypothetical protein
MKYISANQYKQSYAEFVDNYKNTYDIYYSTITFQYTYKKIPLEVSNEYFSYFFKKICTKTCNKTKNIDYYPILIIYPEASLQPVQNHLYNNYHFHMFIMIHKDMQNRFKQKVLMLGQDDQIKPHTNYHLNPDILSPYPKEIKRQKSYLKVNTELTYFVDTSEKILIDNKKEISKDIWKITNYNSKNFTYNGLNFDHVMFFNKSRDSCPSLKH